MIRGTRIIVMFLFLGRTICFSQQLSHQVLVPAAGVATAGVISYSQSVGETAVEMISNSGFIFTQGFQQPGIKNSGEVPPPGTGVDVYPNPATDFINVKLFGQEARTFTIELINMTGMIISTTKMDFITKYFYIEQIEATSLKAGFYFVRVISDDLKINRVFKIEKM